MNVCTQKKIRCCISLEMITISTKNKLVQGYHSLMASRSICNLYVYVCMYLIFIEDCKFLPFRQCNVPWLARCSPSSFTTLTIYLKVPEIATRISVTKHYDFLDHGCLEGSSNRSYTFQYNCCHLLNLAYKTTSVIESYHSPSGPGFESWSVQFHG